MSFWLHLLTGNHGHSVTLYLQSLVSSMRPTLVPAAEKDSDDTLHMHASLAQGLRAFPHTWSRALSEEAKQALSGQGWHACPDVSEAGHQALL